MSLFTNTTASVDQAIIGKTIIFQRGNAGERGYDAAAKATIVATFNQQWGEKPTDGNKCAIAVDHEFYHLVYFSSSDENFEHPGSCTDARRKGGVGGSMGLKGAIASFGLHR